MCPSSSVLNISRICSPFQGNSICICVSWVSADLNSCFSVHGLPAQGLSLGMIRSPRSGVSKRSSSALSFLIPRWLVLGVFGVRSGELLLTPSLGHSLSDVPGRSSSKLLLFPFSGVLAPLNKGLGRLYLGPSPRSAGAKCKAPNPPSPHPSPGLLPLPIWLKSESYPRGSSPPAVACPATQEWLTDWLSLQGIGGAGQLSLIGACLHLDNHAGPSFAPGADSLAHPFSFIVGPRLQFYEPNQVESTLCSGHPGTLDVCQKYKTLELTVEKESTGVREQDQSTSSLLNWLLRETENCMDFARLPIFFDSVLWLGWNVEKSKRRKSKF